MLHSSFSPKFRLEMRKSSLLCVKKKPMVNWMTATTTRHMTTYHKAYSDCQSTLQMKVCRKITKANKSLHRGEESKKTEYCPTEN